MNLRDATPILVTRSGDPVVAGIARPAHDDLRRGREVPHTVLSELLSDTRAVARR